GGGTPVGRGGGWARPGNPSTPPRFFGGRNPSWGGRPGLKPFGNSWFFAAPFDTPLCASPLFPLAPNCSFGVPFGAAFYPPPLNYPHPPPWNGGSPANVVVMAPPPPPVPIISGPGPINTSNSGAISQAGSLDHQAPPLMTLSTPDKCPTLIVLKSG